MRRRSLPLLAGVFACGSGPDPLPSEEVRWSGVLDLSEVGHRELLRRKPCISTGMVELGDVNGDGEIDLLTRPDNSRFEVAVYQGPELDDAFLYEPDVEVAGPHSLFAWLLDLNGDGRDDLVRNYVQLSVLDGTWTDVYLAPHDAVIDPDAPDLRLHGVGADHRAAQAGDVDGDGSVELVLLEPASDNVYIIDPWFPGEDDLISAATARVFLTTADGHKPFLMDVDGDGALEVGVDEGYEPFGSELALFFDGSVTGNVELRDVISTTVAGSCEFTQEPDGDGPFGVGDQDGDGQDDLALVQNGAGCADHGVSILAGPFDDRVVIEEEAVATLLLPGYPSNRSSARMGDVDADGFDDLLLLAPDNRHYDASVMWLVYGPLEGTWGLGLGLDAGPSDPPLHPDAAVVRFPYPESPVAVHDLKVDDIVRDAVGEEVIVGACAPEVGPTAYLLGTGL